MVSGLRCPVVGSSRLREIELTEGEGGRGWERVRESTSVRVSVSVSVCVFVCVCMVCVCLCVGSACSRTCTRIAQVPVGTLTP